MKSKLLPKNYVRKVAKIRSISNFLCFASLYCTACSIEACCVSRR